MQARRRLQSPPAGHRVPLLTRSSEATCGLIPRLSALTVPSSRLGIYPTKLRAAEDTEDVIWPGTLGPGFWGMSQVRPQVTQIATLCVVPRGGCA